MPRGLQEWIHLIEEGEWKRYVKLGTLFLGLITLTVIFDLREYRCYSTQESMEMAQIGRNLADGRGFRTLSIRPVAIHLLQKKLGADANVLKGEGVVPGQSTSIPDLTYPPTYPALLAGLMAVLPFEYLITVPRGGFSRYQPEFLISIFNQALLYAAIVMVFFLARRLFDRPVAWLTAVLLTGTSLLWDFTFSGLPTVLLIDLFLAICWVLVLLEENASQVKRGSAWVLGLAALAGALVGIGGLTVYSFAWLIIPVAVFLAVSCAGRRMASVIAAIAVFAAVLAPWLGRNYQVSQTFFGTAGYSIKQGTSAFPDNRLERTLTAELERAENTIDVQDYFRKLLANSAEIVQNELPKLGGSWITGFFLAGMLIPFRSRPLSRLRYFVLVSLAVWIVAEALGRTHLAADHPVINSENLLIILSPAVFMFGAALYFMVTDLIEFPAPQFRFLLTVLFVLVISAPMVFRWLPPHKTSIAYPPYYPPLIQDTAKTLKPDELMMSDMPWAVAWYGERSCVWLTLDAPMDSRNSARGDFFSISDFQKPILGLYLTPLTTDSRFLTDMIKNRDGVWGRFLLDSLLRTNVSPAFPLRSARSGMLPDQLFLTDRPRWKASVSR